MPFLLLGLLWFSAAPAAEWVRPTLPGDSSASIALPADWIQIEGLYARVHTPESQHAAGLRLSRTAEVSIPRIANTLGLPAARRMDIYLVDNQRDFESLQPRAPPDWADATAWPQQSLIFLRTDRVRGGVARPQAQVLDHEITHVILGQAFGAREVPRWLQEGLSQWIAGEYTPETTRRIASGMLGKGLFKLEELQGGFPRDPVRANLAYAQSADLIAWIAAEYGEEALRKLVIEMARGAYFEAAVRRSTGERVETIDRMWRSRLEESWIWLEPLFADNAWMLMGAGFLVIGFLGVRRRNRKKLARWSREEALEDALYTLILERENLDREEQDPEDDWEKPPSPWLH